MENTPNELVSVTLDMLIKLAKPAASLKLFRSRVRAPQSGGYVSRTKGRGMEFDEVRMYQAGDDIRSIDWRVTARTGKTHTKLFREERERPVFISVDYRASMQFATRGVFKSVQAAKLAGLLAWVAERHGDRIGGQIFTDTSCRELKPQNGKQAVLHFFNALVKTEAKQTPINLEQIIARLNHHVKPGSLVYIISDFRGINHTIENYLAKLARHCDVIMILVYDPLESHLPAKGRYRFTDTKTDIVVDTSDKQQIMSYQEKFSQHCSYLQTLTKKLNIRLLLCASNDKPVEVLR
ncbi:conserved hypothetical protein [Bathymodiolus platifrons methanotrophic gill symbiont]|uniref:DUF58 domain-containing protein n=1 Tax=Bathymodiolus platifrons methanotrophic gill symbiont TaxID=113268 RepID=UPI000B407164|nr:DUF58 domain-containing protein [Bathymodiolus platifrons methanotrophic gill symbiont]MCK5870287.1 DUF58 domain-containing protein [Methyloprofundus sp.]TXK94770.1 DUF58 domain-containing protein [Methylococcaceae bacterium CS5]TXK95105.1 DUF58 domain-containing protein [Methylococcaceae bacterium CS4]TXL03970.1 DUF58 domain-containing protein [Methylococcaceae bacterium CS1]TXL04439.1 DUF58 domain-containing protein [Methylococcaceae bacterium CS3]TXL09451.1 DUF58 domain-containing prote